jgi:hypothetical protein
MGFAIVGLGSVWFWRGWLIVFQFIGFKLVEFMDYVKAFFQTAISVEAEARRLPYTHDCGELCLNEAGCALQASDSMHNVGFGVEARNIHLSPN